MRHFFNTCGLDLGTLCEAIDNAKSQEERIMIWYHAQAQRKFTPHDVCRALEALGFAWPITSVRRAMCNLTEQRRLIKTDHMADGPMGKPNYLWRLP